MSSPVAESYDYIIVGAGSAGCVLANRLSASGRHRVLLLEAGGETHPLSRVPISYGFFIDRPGVNWRYRSSPDPSMGDREIPIPRGRMLGGSSAINGLVFVRGQPLDYDTWAQRGNPGWSYDDVMPYFKKMENFEGGADEWRSEGGPLTVSESPDELPLYDALFQAGEDLGHARNPDYNSPNQEGLCKTQTTISGGRRMSAALCYLQPARRRDNLRVLSNAMTNRLLMQGNRCVAVQFTHDGQTHQVNAGIEVILSSGSINSPQLLELSGIGQASRLKELGISVQHDLPGVGENLRDHLAPRLVTRITERGATYNDRMQGLGKVREVLRYLVSRRGFMSIPSAPMLAFLRTRDELVAPDIQIHFVPFAIKNIQKRSLMPEPGMTATYYQLRPESTGSIHITSDDPRTHPRIDYNFLSAALDRQTIVDGTRMCRQLLDAPGMARLKGEELKPGIQVSSDDEILDWIRGSAETAYHPVGTCKMGSDPAAVVDASLKVHGIDGLRVADGSIMPTLVSGNTNAACIMIGEKASDLILADAQR